MKRTPLLLLVGLSVTGLASGYVAKRLAGPEAPAAVANDASPAAGASDRRGAASPATAAVLESIRHSTIRSTDTLETAKTLEGPDAYQRLALWMVDASEPEIAAYWQHYRQQEGRSNEITDLIFINWTRIDPRAATAAAKGTGDEHYAWWAWACHDPKTALETAIAENPDRVNNVTWGIGEFHKDWLREHFDELPEGSRDNALQGMAKWDDGENPLETLEFLREKGHGFHEGIFKVLVRKDPWAAYDWIEENGSNLRCQYGMPFDAMGSFVETVGEQYPDVLKRLADQAPSGELKRKLEKVMFENLLKTDPEAAIEQAKQTKAPAVAKERLAAAGLALVGKEPERGFELAESLFAAHPGALSGMTRIEYSGGSSGWGGGSEEVNQLMDALMMRDPERVMKMVSTDPGGGSGSSLNQLATKWAEQDIAGYSEWAKRQSDPQVREQAAGVMVNKLQEEQQFEDAAAWAMNLEQSRSNYLANIGFQWNRKDPEGFAAWLENAELTDSEFEMMQSTIRLNP